MKICPECQTRYDDDVSACPTDGEELVELPDELSGNPALLEPVVASPADRTSMLDLEALEAKRAARRQRPDEDEDAGADDETPPPTAPLDDDIDATGTMQRRGGRASKGAPPATQVGATRRTVAHERDAGGDAGGGAGRDERDAVASDARSDDDPSEENAGQTRARERRLGRTRNDTAIGGGGTRTSLPRAKEATRAGRAEDAPAQRARRRGSDGAKDQTGARGVRAAALTAIALCVVVGGIVAVARGTAVLTITTVPPGAAVNLDGTSLGTSPVQKRVRVGGHVVELELEGFLPFKEVVDVPAGGLPYLQPLQKRPPPPPPPPTSSEIADDLARQAKRLADSGDLDGALLRIEDARKLAAAQPLVVEVGAHIDAAKRARDEHRNTAAAAAAREQRLQRARVLASEGKLLYEKGRLGAAKDKLYASLQLDANNPEPHRVLSRIFNREDQVEKVRYHLTRYLELGGQDADFKVREWLKTHPP